MFTRFYDPESKHGNGVLKEYTYWMLEVSYNQHTFGCYILFCKRKGVEKISELTTDELIEFQQVCKEIENSLLVNPIFKPDRFNYCQLGNALHQLHFHGIPRYATERKLGHRVFNDTSFGNLPTWSRDSIDDETVGELKYLMLEYL